MEIFLNNSEISSQTKEAAVLSYKLQVQNLFQDMLLKDQQINLTKEQAKAVAENVVIGYINANANKESASKWTWQQALGNALVESGLNKNVSEQLKEGTKALENLIPKEGDTFWKWLKRNW